MSCGKTIYIFVRGIYFAKYYAGGVGGGNGCWGKKLKLRVWGNMKCCIHPLMTIVALFNTDLAESMGLTGNISCLTGPPVSSIIQTIDKVINIDRLTIDKVINKDRLTIDKLINIDRLTIDKVINKDQLTIDKL